MTMIEVEGLSDHAIRRLNDMVPGHLVEGIRAYVEEGRSTGHFLKAVFENDLFKAIAWADRNSMEGLESICRWIYSHAPSDCWGSQEKREDWMIHHGMLGMVDFRRAVSMALEYESDDQT